MSAEIKPAVRIKIMEAEYSVTGYPDPEYVQQIAALVDRHMRLLQQLQSDIPPLKNAVLTALNLADELLRTKKQLEQYQEEALGFSREIAERSRQLSELCAL